MRRPVFGFAVLMTAIVLQSDRISAQSSSAQKVAQQSGEDIVKALGQQKYKLVWDEKVSQWFKKQVTEDGFLANMSMGRAQLGSMQSTSLVSSEYASTDPSSGFRGDIYALTFRSKYANGELYERIVVIKDIDGQFKLSGIFASPVPK